MRYARKRDIAEKAIVDALHGAGCSVQRLDITGAPDLLVGRAGFNYLLEVKDFHGKAYDHAKRTDDGLLDSQRAWWARWRGRPPVVVTTPAEALEAIGLRCEV